MDAVETSSDVEVLYRKRSLLGSGTFGKVWLGYHVKSLKTVVLKEVQLTNLSAKQGQMAKKEVDFISNFDHPNIIGYLASCISRISLTIVLEYAENGDLSHRIAQQRGVAFGEKRVIDWFVQLMAGLNYVHQKNVLHRDLKSQNLLLSKDDTLKLADFGIACQLNEFGGRANTALGTPYFLSPEICAMQQYDYKSDIWAAGCILYEMAALKVPFPGKDVVEVIRKIKEGRVPPLPRLYEGLVWRMVTAMLQREPHRRPSAARILSLPDLKPFLRSYEQRFSQAAVSVDCVQPSKTPSRNTEQRTPLSSDQRRSVFPSAYSVSPRTPLLAPSNISLHQVSLSPSPLFRPSPSTPRTPMPSRDGQLTTPQQVSTVKRKSVENCAGGGEDSSKRVRLSPGSQVKRTNKAESSSSSSRGARSRRTSGYQQRRVPVADQSSPSTRVSRSPEQMARPVSRDFLLSPVVEKPDCCSDVSPLFSMDAVKPVINSRAPRLSLLPILKEESCPSPTNNKKPLFEEAAAVSVQKESSPLFGLLSSPEQKDSPVFSPGFVSLEKPMYLSPACCAEMLYQLHCGELSGEFLCSKLRYHLGAKSFAELKIMVDSKVPFSKILQFLGIMNAHILPLILAVAVK